ncbi:leucine-rich repeat domain-containing protein [Raoultibacter phocaeensis]|uniref:leucine-rich repeat domain-containing protein n=1 Tax=Raoultibacter phocaeensis TaxID=2479841 RepID=UPI0011184C49|nr:leucine-rich repeat domain-containing protein [Raoultibacter phocaeensis]
MRQRNLYLGYGRRACALFLACLLVVGSYTGPAPASLAYASDAEAGATESPQADQKANASSDVESEGAQTEAPPAESDAVAGDEAGSATQIFEEVPLVKNDAEPDGSKEPAQSDAVEPERVSTDIPLTEGGASAAAGTMMVDGLKYRVNPDGATASLTGWHGAKPVGGVSVASKVVSGSDEYAVTKIAEGALKDCNEIASIALPSTLKEIAEGAFAGCTSLASFSVGEGSASFSVHDGMLLDAAGSALVLCPEGKAGVANVPDQTSDIPVLAFKGCSKLTGIAASEGNASYTAVGGILYSKDRSELIYCPAGAGEAVTVSADTTRIGASAFADNAAIASITALGFVETIDATAFTEEIKQAATVALAAGENYEARKAVWTEAGFEHFVDPAVSGEVEWPEQGASGFAYTLLDDYTLSVSWEGEEDPEPDLVIPSAGTVAGTEYRVTRVADYAFAGRPLTSVEIPSSIVSIGEGAFRRCASLASIDMAEGLQSVGAYAFSGTAVESAELPASANFWGGEHFLTALPSSAS